MIYFIEAMGTGLIKIGFSDDDPDGRLQTLQVGSPVKLTRLALMTGNRIGEGKIHARFARDRSHGEWFRDTPRLRAFIRDRAAPWDGPVVPGGSMVPARVVQEWAEMLAYAEGIPGCEAQLEALWPRIDGVKLDIKPAFRWK